jgi:tyrosine-specific transport protein
MKNPVLLAALSLVGTIVGAGIFGVPFVFAQAGVGIGLLYCLVLGATALLNHWFYAQVCIHVQGRHRLVGHARVILGPLGAWVAAATNPLGLLGSILAYYILGGSFLNVLFGGDAFTWVVVFFAAMALLSILPFKKLLKFEDFFTWLLIASAAVIIAIVSPHVQLENLLTVNRDNWFLPFGIVFFSLGGASVIPDLVEGLNKNRRRIASSIIIGTVVSAMITAAFGLAVSGASGALTSENAIAGLVPLVGKFIVTLGAAFGLLAIVTSFVTAAANLKEQFNYDFKLPAAVSYILAVGLPFAAYLLGAQSFVGVIGFVGAVLGVIDGIIIALMARSVVKSSLRFLAVPLIVVFFLGLVSEIIYLAK